MGEEGIELYPAHLSGFIGGHTGAFGDNPVGMVGRQVGLVREREGLYTPLASGRKASILFGS